MLVESAVESPYLELTSQQLSLAFVAVVQHVLVNAYLDRVALLVALLSVRREIETQTVICRVKPGSIKLRLEHMSLAAAHNLEKVLCSHEEIGRFLLNKLAEQKSIETVSTFVGSLIIEPDDYNNVGLDKMFLYITVFKTKVVNMNQGANMCSAVSRSIKYFKSEVFPNESGLRSMVMCVSNQHVLKFQLAFPGWDEFNIQQRADIMTFFVDNGFSSLLNRDGDSLGPCRDINHHLFLVIFNSKALHDHASGICQRYLKSSELTAKVADGRAKYA